MAAAAQTLEPAPHVPVLIESIIDAVKPVSGTWIDGTLGAGGYARRLLDAGADALVGIDRDPDALRLADDWGASYGDRLRVYQGTFSEMEHFTDRPVQGAVLDLGVSSMQLDQSERGFSFNADGPLDMRMAQEGQSAADLVNTLDADDLADILYHYGEERAARRIARAIVREREGEPITSTARLVRIIESALPPRKPGQSHSATRSFQALRIAVNDEFGELVAGLEAAERVLQPGGQLAVVTFHSLEDRIVKRFFREGAGRAQGSRYAPEVKETAPRWIVKGKGVVADDAEIAANPRARSATLRIGVRTEAPAERADRAALGVPDVTRKGGR